MSNQYTATLERRVQRLTRTLIRVQAIAFRCPGIDTTDQVTGETFREAIKIALESKDGD